MAAPPQPGAGAWSSSLYSCFDDCGLCCITCFCPCVTFGRIAEIVDSGNTSCGMAGGLYLVLAWFTGCQCIYSMGYRTKLRRKYNLPEEPCNDCCIHCCCEGCSLCQEYRHLQAGGYDPAAGWDYQPPHLKGQVAPQFVAVGAPAPQQMK